MIKISSAVFASRKKRLRGELSGIYGDVDGDIDFPKY